MKSEVENLEPTRVKLTVEAPFEELAPTIDKAYREVAGQINIPGFRRGKAPKQIIDQRVGRGVVLEQAVNAAIAHRGVAVLTLPGDVGGLELPKGTPAPFFAPLPAPAAAPTAPAGS